MFSCGNLVSVVIPTYNYAGYLGQCIKSLLNREYKNLDIVIVDDGSIDDTERVVKQFDDSRVRYIYQDNAGPSAARNRGIEASHGNYFVFLDADDLLGEGYFRTQLQSLKRNTMYGAALCANRFFSGLDNVGKPIVTGQWKTRENHYNIHILYFNLCPPHSLLYKREVVEKTGFFSTNVTGCEDYEFLLRVFATGTQVIYNDKAIVYYRQHQHNRSKQKARVYKSDIDMHKLALDLSRDGKLLGYQRLAGRYALLSGMLSTWNRVSNKKVKGVEQLKDMIVEEFGATCRLDRSINIVELLYIIMLKKRLFSSMRSSLPLGEKVISHYSLLKIIFDYLSSLLSPVR